MKKNNKGFTLIELLIVIAIIGILAGVILVSTGNARTRAINVSTKQALSSIKNGIATCCYGASSATLNAAQGADICTPNTGAKLPSGTQLKASADTSVSYVVTHQCNVAAPNIPTITATIAAGTHSGGCDGIFVITADGIASGTGLAGCI